MAVVVAAAGALSACATSNVATTHASNLAPTRFMAAAGPATPPAGFLEFCARSPKDCGLQTAAAVAPARAATFQSADAPAAAPRAPRAGYDWSGAFGAARPAQDSDQAAALRQQLYGRYMWQAAFAAAPRAPLPAPAVEAAPPAIEAPGVQTAVLQQDAPAGFAVSSPYLVKASYAWVAQGDAWSQLRSDDGQAQAPLPTSEQAPAVTDQAQAAPAAAVAPMVQPLVMTKGLAAQLAAIDRRINRRIVQTEDVRLYGQDDYWAMPIEDAAYAKGVVRGDCEDYALEKRRALIEAGVPADVLSIAVADTRFGPHAVLLVDTDHGELVLDSLSGKLVAWDRTGYRWIKRQAWGDPMSWVEIAQNN